MKRRIIIYIIIALFVALLSMVWLHYAELNTQLEERTKSSTTMHEEQKTRQKDTPFIEESEFWLLYYADSNEQNPEIGEIYYAARNEIANGDWEIARRLLQEGVTKYPNSRHLHQQLANDLTITDHRLTKLVADILGHLRTEK